MPKKKTPSYIELKPEMADRLRELGFRTVGNHIPANRKARLTYASLNNGFRPPAVVLPRKKVPDAT